MKLVVVAVAVLESVTRAVMDDVVAVVGVPEITPLEVSIVSPAGSVPLGSEKVLPPDPPEVESERE